MLDLIFNMIGTPSEDDLSFVTDQKALAYLAKFERKKPRKLRKRYPAGSDDALRILRSMLEFNPYNRPIVSELLSDSYFDDVRHYSQALEAPEEISFEFDEGRKFMSIS